ncbi:hypothetical protein BZG35_09470 [Brevundimonas sp. LM2]|nr:hypothetical protein BZG35_09470 [Brevundimonas sp. LM2]
MLTAELKVASGLTNEEIAPLLGVSHRSLQTWLAGSPIGARKEARLRAVLDAVRALAAITTQATRARLFDRGAHSVRPYDLLIEGRFDAAVDLATGRRRALPPTERAQNTTVAAQLDRIENAIDTPSGPLNRRLSGPLRR